MKGNIENNDKLLLLKAKQGDSVAFGLLFDKYSAKIFRFVYYKVSSKELAEDITSQCFLKIWQSLLKGTKVQTFQAWAYQIARNMVIDYYRQRDKEELPLIYDENTEEEFGKVDPEMEIEKAQLEKILLKLKTDIREIIVLRYIEGMSIKEVAKIVDKSPANIRVIIHRALKDLKKYLS